MKKRLILFTPVIVALTLANIVTIAVMVVNKSWIAFLAAILLLISSIFVLIQIALMNRSINKVYKNMGKLLSPYQNQSLNEFPLPVVVAKPGGEIIWYNPVMQERVFGGDDFFGMGINEVFPDLNLAVPCPPQGFGVEHKGKQFSAFSAKSCTTDDQFNILYFFDDDKLKRIAREYFASRPVVAVIMIDNYEELLQSARENERSQIMAEIEYQIERFVDEYNGVIKKLEKDKFFAVFEERYVHAVVETRFTILDIIRKINANDKMPATLSIGMGRDAQDLAQAEKFANQALDMALGRGGDQSAVKNKSGYEFYGGVSKGIEKRTKVKTRIVAAALMELIESSSNVLIMGHRFADLDCLGAAVGIYHPICSMGKNAKIVLNKNTNLVAPLYDKLMENKFDDVFVEPENALVHIEDNTLLIVVDTHTPHFVESPDVYKHCKNVVVIDHHRKMVDYIDNAVIFHHEPYASSASEMVSELLQYFGDKYKPTSIVAEALLAGVMLDTKNFVMRTGVRTFEAAAYLRRMGADTVEVKRMFSTSMHAYRQKCTLVASAEVYKRCAIAGAKDGIDEIKVVAPQAADDLLGIAGVDASFVFYMESEEKIAFSARSMGKINVQIIMEKLGGGGHLTMAGAQIKGTSTEEAKEKLIAAIDEYFASLDHSA